MQAAPAVNLLPLARSPLRPGAVCPKAKPHSPEVYPVPARVEVVPAAQLPLFMESHPLVLDLRPYNLYLKLRLVSAHNVCVPSTLLKRTTYGVQHLANASSLPEETKQVIKDKLQTVLMYDASSHGNSVLFALHQMLAKFVAYGTRVAYLDGGFAAVGPELVDSLSLESASSLSSPRLHSPNNDLDDSLPLLSGFTLPSATSSSQRLLMLIKKNLPRLDTSTTYNYSFRWPRGFEATEALLPTWMGFLAGDASKEHNAAVINAISDRFSDLERCEQVRLNKAIANEAPDALEHEHRHRHEELPLGLCPFCDHIDYTIPKGVEYGYKNRYNNIWPYEHLRVKLVSSPCATAPPQDDYFNANYIHFPQLTNRGYIATQSPLDSTLEDFWSTVWYNGVRAIVCLNNPQELLPKSYYTANARFESLGLNVEIASCDKRQGYSMRKINLKKRGQTRTVSHFHFHEWPDFGTPPDFGAILSMIEEVDKVLVGKSAEPPTTEISRAWDLVVHCSAGCGRTGSYITLDMVTKSLATNEKLWRSSDLIYKSVQFQRQQRIAMVQNLDQFIYCYEGVMAWLANRS